MKVRVFLLRQRGRRTQRADTHEGVEGNLQMSSTVYGSESHATVTLRPLVAHGVRDPELLPPLFSPHLVAVGNDAMLLRGFEAENGTAYVQEWRCVIG
jgi:hypothetical protein